MLPTTAEETLKAPTDTVKEEAGIRALAGGCSVPKELNSTRLDQFREISLLGVKGKIFSTIIAKMITTYRLANEFIDLSVRKEGVPGCSVAWSTQQ